MPKTIVLITFCLTFSQQLVAKYSKDYSVNELVKTFTRLSALTFGRLLLGNDTIGPIEQEVKFFCYNRQTNQYIQTFVNDPDLASKLDASKPLHVVTHGWISSMKQEWAKEFRKDMKKFIDVNACVVDWERLSNFEYTITATQHVPMVGDYIAEFTLQAYRFGIALNDITLVGHSLGGQISGRAGLKVFQRLGDKIGTIFGLDPANPLYCFPSVVHINKRLDPTDAKFVQIIHSSDGTLGCGIDHGDQDFRPDAGIIPQTGCIAPVFGQTVARDPLGCSHYQSVLYYQYSMNPSNFFVARKCSSFFNFIRDRCDPITDIIGPYTKRKPGRFYLRTSAFAPFTPVSRTGKAQGVMGSVLRIFG